MKRVFFLFIFSVFFFSLPGFSQDDSNSLMKQAETAQSNREYVKARYLYLQAYKKFANEGNYEKAADCGVNVSALYHRENFYKEAFDMLRTTDMLIATGEQQTRKSLKSLHYPVTKERLRMYIKLRNSAKASDQLNILENIAQSSESDELKNDFLYTQANYYYTFGMTSKGDEAINKLISTYKEQKDYDKISECYKTLISFARQANNAGLVAKAYDKYIVWADSAKAYAAQEKYDALKKQYDESQTIIDDKDSSLSAKQYIIIGLCVLVAILVGVLIVGAVVLMRFILLTRKQKKTIAIANEHNELKTQFIRNISAQMEPTLDTLDGTQPGVRALKEFSTHIQELSELENSLTEPYPMEEKNVATFCESVADKIRDKVKPGVTVAVNAPKINVKINPEKLEQVLLHLLNNAVIYTPEDGKITLEFKKRGAHSHQFIVSDTGCTVPEELRENLFKPFTEIKDLTKGDGLGLPICSLIATKMNGTLELDKEYTKGARFVLNLHP
ncbi:HAMP domain-containing sensor histidine kinase [uncultured Bacteroides sp.]|uniref:sensor histidine kinase n=1 Tax=uncultured Bacteroides sp. TaxID=162156 RepID=UPI002639CFC8|nr:HAMP domain-containing sensor histidine kinase [uncultured Bacteroides sp.]